MFKDFKILERTITLPGTKQKMSTWTGKNNKIDVSYDKSKRFMCVEHPALVQNHEKAINTIGGLKNLEKVMYFRECTTFRSQNFSPLRHFVPLRLTKLYYHRLLQLTYARKE